MSKIVTAILCLIAAALLVPLYQSDTGEETPTVLEGASAVTGLTWSQPTLETPPPPEDHAQAPVPHEESTTSSHAATSPTTTDPATSLTASETPNTQGMAAPVAPTPPAAPTFPELVVKEAKDPSAVCSIFGPFKESKLEGYHQAMQKVGITGRVLIEPANLTTKIQLLTGPFKTDEEAVAMKKTLDEAGIPSSVYSGSGKRTTYRLGREFTDIVKAETFLNRVRQKVPSVGVRVEREVPEAGPMVQLVFLEMKEDEYAKVQSFVAKQDGHLKGCPY